MRWPIVSKRLGLVMTLSELVQDRFNGNVSAFARALSELRGADAKPIRQSTARKWLLPCDHRDYAAPSRRNLALIKQLSGGEVTASDVLDRAA